MDPDANLSEQLDLAKVIIDNIDAGTEPDTDDVARLAELVLALNKWLHNGGFLPEAWKGASRP
jgi:hypothetical protein